MTPEQQSNLLSILEERIRHIDEKIDAILEQTTKTNGRLLKAEHEIDDIQLWKAEIKGSFKTLIAIFTAIGVIIGWIIYEIK
jgi:hypothetical protein